MDVIMYDAIKRDSLISEGWIQAVIPQQIREAEDLFPFALEGLTVNDQLYGIPVFLYGNFLTMIRMRKHLRMHSISQISKTALRFLL